MPKRITYQDKMDLLDRYIKRPHGVKDPEILRAIKVDVVRGTVKGTKKASQIDNTLYNEAMGIYRQFLKGRDSHLSLQGKKARDYKDAMNNLMEWIRTMQVNNKMPSGDQDVLRGLVFIFKHWDRLNDFHRNRLGLPDIYKSIEEIVPIIKNGHDKKSTAKSKLEQLELNIKGKRR